MTGRLILLTVMALVLTAASGDTVFADDPGRVPLFDGKTLDGWKVNGGFASYKVEDGAIVGTTAEGSPNNFLCKGEFKDFVLEPGVRCDPRLKSGVQVRSHVYETDDPDPRNRQKAGVVYGPQCEIARKETVRRGGQPLGLQRHALGTSREVVLGLKYLDLDQDMRPVRRACERSPGRGRLRRVYSHAR